MRCRRSTSQPHPPSARRATCPLASPRRSTSYARERHPPAHACVSNHEPSGERLERPLAGFATPRPRALAALSDGALASRPAWMQPEHPPLFGAPPPESVNAVRRDCTTMQSCLRLDPMVRQFGARFRTPSVAARPPPPPPLHVVVLSTRQRPRVLGRMNRKPQFARDEANRSRSDHPVSSNGDRSRARNASHSPPTSPGPSSLPHPTREFQPRAPPKRHRLCVCSGAPPQKRALPIQKTSAATPKTHKPGHFMTAHVPKRTLYRTKTSTATREMHHAGHFLTSAIRKTHSTFRYILRARTALAAPADHPLPRARCAPRLRLRPLPFACVAHSTLVPISPPLVASPQIWRQPTV